MAEQQELQVEVQQVGHRLGCGPREVLVGAAGHDLALVRAPATLPGAVAHLVLELGDRAADRPRLVALSHVGADHSTQLASQALGRRVDRLERVASRRVRGEQPSSVEHARVGNERMPRMRGLVLAHHHPRADQGSIGVLLKRRDPFPHRVDLVARD